ncbi:BTB domain-containing protein [Trichoderma simmonsii]|uniref:BTB domain-containing protein n=1 Tax=Trichoderma simmonsii TaxID=1491479 RepID=A0A8G0PLJ6_9HYPO|nr:BTB domain-containing protein [Trichoderma simmonsii]
MNSIPPDVIASSVPFRFLVGPHEREFTIHSALFICQSPVFERLANGSFTEAAEKCVKWASVDEDTFLRFWQYTYTGNYAAAAPVSVAIESKSEDIPERPLIPSPPQIQPPIQPLPFSGLFDSGRPPPTRHVPPEELKRKALWAAFLIKRSSDPVAPSYTPGSVRFPGATKNHANEDYTNTFLSHARLFTFAECYGITALMTHSLDELHGTLERFTLHKERVDDVVALVDYCYENMAPEPLRDLVTLYAACKINKLWKSEKFCALVEAHSDLSMALLGLMVNEL